MKKRKSSFFIHFISLKCEFRLNTNKRVIKKTLNGDFNYSLETLITLANTIGYNIEITFNKK